MTDKDMPWAEDSNIYVEHEKQVMAGGNFPVIEPLNGIKNIQLMTKKECVYDCKGNIVGTIAQAIELSGAISYQSLFGHEKYLSRQSYDNVLTKAETRIIYL